MVDEGVGGGALDGGVDGGGFGVGVGALGVEVAGAGEDWFTGVEPGVCGGLIFLSEREKEG